MAQTLAAVRVYDRQRDATTQLSNADCGFGYRTSAFKRAAAAVNAGANDPATVAAGALAGT